MFKRWLNLSGAQNETFFLWGPRQTGKTTLLRQTFPEAVWIDLLRAEEFRRYLQNPEFLRQEVSDRNQTPFVVVDEIQKLPLLLDEVHWIHENLGIQFALCGSSARKVKRGHANLLGGRAIRRELFGLVSGEIGHEFDLTRILNHGYLPRIYQTNSPKRLLHAYVANYLKEEVASEGLVRNLPVFSEFLSVAALSDTEPVNFSNIARECGVSSHTVKNYFQILEDTLLGTWLPVYRKRPKRRIAVGPKFYFSDVGVVNFLTRRHRMEPKSELFGKAFENWIHHELRSFNSYAESFAHLSYWRLTTGVEVDFIVNDMELAIEAKAASKITDRHLKGLRELKAEHPTMARRLLVCLEPKARRTSDGIEIVPFSQFTDQLWNKALF